MKTIIISTDYSDAANNAMEYAAALSKYTGAKLILFNAFHLPLPVSGTPFLIPDIDDAIIEHNRRLEKLGSKISEDYGIEVKCISRPSFVVDELSELARQYNADLVVMGMRGGSIDYKIFGSVTNAVIRESNFPVLVIPVEAKFKAIERIIFACDYSCLPADTNLSLLREFASLFQSRVQVLHVEKLKELATIGASSVAINTANMEAVLKNLAHEYLYLVDDKVVDGIEKGVKDFEADLLVMVPHELSFWDEVFNKSKTRKTALRTKIPLLSIPGSK